MKTLLLAFFLSWAYLAWAVERDPNEGPPKNFKAPVSPAKKLKTKTKNQTSPSTNEVTLTEEKAITENTATSEIEEVVALKEELPPTDGEDRPANKDRAPEEEDDEESSSTDTAKLFALDPTPTPLPQLDPESEAFFTEVDELNEYFHQLKQPPAPTPTVAPLKPPLDPPRTVFRALLKKGAVVRHYENTSQQITTNRDYFVQAAISDFRSPVIILDRQGHPAYQASRQDLVDLQQDLNFKLSPLTTNPQQAWLRDELRRNDPAPIFLQRLLAGAGESTLAKTNLPNLTRQSLLHAFLEYQIIYYWPFPVRLGLASSFNYEKYQEFSWPSWSIGPLATYHFLWGRHQFEIIGLWQYLFYSNLSFADPQLAGLQTMRGSGSSWQLGLNYLFIYHGKVFPCGIFYQQGSYNFDQNPHDTNYDVENTAHQLQAIGLRFGWQWD